MDKKLLLVDVDCGVDDAQALMLALAAPHVEILGITCCHGNTSLENVCRNVLRVLKLCNRLQIPVYGGATRPLLGNSIHASHYHGVDGLGDVPDSTSPDLDFLQKEHAVLAMIRIVNEYPGQFIGDPETSKPSCSTVSVNSQRFEWEFLFSAETVNKVSLVASGPLTNLALAVNMDSTFPQKVKSLFIMGGNMESRGNVTVCGEFNFACDPEAAYIVLNGFDCPTHIASWEFTCKNGLSWEFYHEWISQKTEKAEFMSKICAHSTAFSEHCAEENQDWTKGFVSCDSYAMAAAIDDKFVTDGINCAVGVELSGTLTRGMMVLDTSGLLQRKHKVFVMTKCDTEKLKFLLMEALR